MTAFAASLLTACTKEPVAVPVAIKPVSPALMRAPGLPRCDLPRRADYDPREVIAYAKCWEAAYHALASRHIGLQRAVAVRERAAARAVATAKM